MGIRKIKYIWLELINIEEVLNELEHKQVKLGGLFANLLYSSLYIKGYEFNLLNKLKIYYQLIKTGFVPLSVSPKNRKYPRKKYIFNYTANINKLTEFFLPLLDHIDVNDVLFVSKAGHPFRGDTSLDFYAPSTLSYREWKEWKKEYEPVHAHFKRLKPILKSRFNIHGALYLYLKVTLKYQTQRLYLFNKLLAEVKPEVIVTDHDRQSINSALIIAGKQLHIPTYTFIHGSTDPEANFLPLIADHMFCWGQKHVDQFMKFNISSDHLIIAGNPRLHRTGISSGLQVQDKILVSFISNPIDLQERMILAEIFGEAIEIAHQINPNISGLIKLHPNESADEYKKIGNRYEHLSIVTSAEMDNKTLFDTSAIIVSHNSTMSFDALVEKRTVIILNPPDVYFPLGIGKDLITYAGCAEAKDTPTLAESILQAAERMDNKTNNELAEAYMNYYCRYWGDDSAKKISETITQHIHP